MTQPSNDFGSFIKDQRLGANMTLRDFCRQIDIDPSNWNKVERGLLRPPKNKIKRIAKVLGLFPGSWQNKSLYDLAADLYIPNEIKKGES